MFHFCFSPHHPLIIHIKTDFCTSPFSRKLNCQHTVPQACQILEILLYIYCITFHNAYVRYLEYHVYIVAIMNCIWFESLDCGYTWALLNTTCLFQLHRRSLLWSHCWTELIHKAVTVTFNHAHIAPAINTRCWLMKTKRKRRKIPSSAHSAYMMKWKLNPLMPELNLWCWN